MSKKGLKWGIRSVVPNMGKLAESDREPGGFESTVGAVCAETNSRMLI